MPLGDDVERVLQAVVHLGEQPGAELDREQVAHELHGVADPDAGSALEHLRVGIATAHADDLGDEPHVVLQDVSDLVLGHGGVELHCDEVAVDPHHATAAHAHDTLPASSRSTISAVSSRPRSSLIAAHFSLRRSLNA